MNVNNKSMINFFTKIDALEKTHAPELVSLLKEKVTMNTSPSDVYKLTCLIEEYVDVAVATHGPLHDLESAEVAIYEALSNGSFCQQVEQFGEIHVIWKVLLYKTFGVDTPQIIETLEFARAIESYDLNRAFDTYRATHVVRCVCGVGPFINGQQVWSFIVRFGYVSECLENARRLCQIVRGKVYPTFWYQNVDRAGAEAIVRAMPPEFRYIIRPGRDGEHVFTVTYINNEGNMMSTKVFKTKGGFKFDDRNDVFKDVLEVARASANILGYGDDFEAAYAKETRI